jgi:hypothetical protein
MAISTIGASALDSGVSQLGKNLIHNGAMRVAQRGTSVASVSTGFTIDRWNLFRGAGASALFTVSQESSGGVDGNQKWQKALVTTANASPSATNVHAFEQWIEAQNAAPVLLDSSGDLKDITIGVDVILHADGASSITFPATVAMGLRTFDGTGRVYLADQTVTAADTWQRITFTVPAGETTATIDNDNGAGIALVIGLYAGSSRLATSGVWQNDGAECGTAGSDNIADATNNYIGFTLAQLEVGSVATDFEHEDYGTTLQKCRRYFQAITIDTDAGYAAEASGSTSAYTAIIPYISYNWRATPSASIRTNSNMRYRSYLSGFISATTSSSASNAAFPHAAGFYISCSGTLSGLTDGMPGLLNATGTMLVDFSAEL